MTLFPKLALITSILLMSVIAGLSSIFYWSERRTIRDQVSAEQIAILHNLNHIAQESYVSGDDLLLLKYTSGLTSWTPSLTSVCITNDDNVVIAHSNPNYIGHDLNQVPFETGVLRLTRPITVGNHRIGNVSISFSEQKVDQTIQERTALLKHRLFKVTGVALGLGLMVSFLLALSWRRPIARLVLVSERIGSGEWNISVDNLTARRDELGSLARAFKTMAAQLKELDRMKEDFVSSVTHELRSPLGAIESYLNLIQSERQKHIPEESWTLYLDRMQANTQRLTRFVNDLLDVAAIERGKLTLKLRELNIHSLLQDVALLFEAKGRERQLHLHVLESSLCLTLWADTDKLRQVLINLVSNAVKFTPDGGHITLGAEQHNDSLTVFVQDTGPGIDEVDQKRIFNKFEQLTDARHRVKGAKGTGLGLAISRALVELHGGQLKVSSRLGEGCTFSFSIPHVKKEVLL